MKLSEQFITIFKCIKRIILFICFIAGVITSSLIIYFIIIWMTDTSRSRYLDDGYAIITDDCSNPGLYKVLVDDAYDCGHSQRYIFTASFDNPNKCRLIDKETASISEPMTSEEFLHTYDSLGIKYEYATSGLRRLIDDHEKQETNRYDNN